MQLSPHLNFNGQCREAFKLYQECLGGTPKFAMTWGESPMADKVPAEWRDKIIHAALVIGETTLTGADASASVTVTRVTRRRAVRPATATALRPAARPAAVISAYAGARDRSSTRRPSRWPAPLCPKRGNPVRPEGKRWRKGGWRNRYGYCHFFTLLVWSRPLGQYD